MVAPQLRPARTDDISDIRAVLEASWSAAYGPFLEAAVRERVHEAWHDPESLRTSIETADRITTVASRDGTIVGYMAAWLPEPEDDPSLGVVGLLYVDPEYWGEGIGTALWERALASLRERGANRVSVRVFAANDVGRSFYESLGLELTGRLEEDLFGQRVETVEYQRRL